MCQKWGKQARKCNGKQCFDFDDFAQYRLIIKYIFGVFNT